MIITKEFLETLKSPAGGWPRETTTKLGVKWPLKSGWAKKLIGKKIDASLFPVQARQDPVEHPNNFKNHPKCIIFSDGACDNSHVGNGTNAGGWGCIIRYEEKEMLRTGTEIPTTNQRMEVAGIRECLPFVLLHGIKNIEIVTDSKYVMWGINRRERWKRKPEGYANPDLWNPIYDVIEKYNPHIIAKWVKGHNGHPENERCNTMAEESMQSLLV